MPQSLDSFLKKISPLPYSQKYKRSTAFIAEQSEQQTEDLTTFLEVFPFCTTYWFRLLELLPNSQHRELFKRALGKCPQSYLLWQAYLEHLRIHQPSTIGPQSARALQCVGQHFLSADIAITYLRANNLPFEQVYMFFKKNLSKPINIQPLLEFSNEWVNDLKADDLKVLYQLNHRRKPQGDIQKYRVELVEQLQKAANSGSQYRSLRISLRSDLVESEQYGQGAQTQKWIKFIQFQKQSGTIQNLRFCYEQALCALCDNQTLWQEAIAFFEYQLGNYQIVLQMFRQNGSFFVNLSPRLCYYWCDLEQREKSGFAKQIYASLQSLRPELETYMRHVGFEVRAKQLIRAKSLFDSMLLIFSQQHEILSFIVIEYANFIRKHFSGHSGDLQFPKKLILNYLETLPFNEYLYFSSLQFFRGQIRKSNFQDLSNVIAVGIKKAKQGLGKSQLGEVVRGTKINLRKCLSHIQLILLIDKQINAILAS